MPELRFDTRKYKLPDCICFKGTQCRQIVWMFKVFSAIAVFSSLCKKIYGHSNDKSQTDQEHSRLPLIPLPCCLHVCAVGLAGADTVVNMRKVTHERVQEPLSGTALLPCVFTLRPSPSHEPPRIKWTKVWGPNGPGGPQREQSVLVAKGNVIKVKKAFQGRVTLPGYPDNRYNASLAMTGLRTSDSGMYRCEVVVGINDEQDIVPLEVTGKGLRLHY